MGRWRDHGAKVVPTEISPEGAFAGRFAVTLLVSAVALIGVSWDDVWRVCNAVSGPCVERSASATILSMCSLAAIVWGVGILVRIQRRPVDPQASSRYVLALGALHPPSTSEPASRLLLRKAVVVLGVLGGILVWVRPRNVRVTPPLSVAAWGIGFGWLILDTMT